MEITLELLEHLSKLARIELSDEKKSALLKDLSEILSYSQELEKVDTSKVAEDSAALRAFESLPVHKDEPKPGLSAADAMRPAPERLDDYFKVPPVIE